MIAYRYSVRQRAPGELLFNGTIAACIKIYLLLPKTNQKDGFYPFKNIETPFKLKALCCVQSCQPLPTADYTLRYHTRTHVVHMDI